MRYGIRRLLVTYLFRTFERVLIDHSRNYTQYQCLYCNRGLYLIQPLVATALYRELFLHDFCRPVVWQEQKNHDVVRKWQHIIVHPADYTQYHLLFLHDKPSTLVEIRNKRSDGKRKNLPNSSAELLRAIPLTIAGRISSASSTSKDCKAAGNCKTKIRPDPINAAQRKTCCKRRWYSPSHRHSSPKVGICRSLWRTSSMTPHLPSYGASPPFC